MVKLAGKIATVIVNEYGGDEFLRRVSDPYWFQAFGCVLGYDWHSSGVTTVLTGVLKNALKPEEHGLALCGGKGKASKQAPTEISQAAEKFNLSTDRIGSLHYASKMAAKVDSAAIQAGYPLYHHAFLLSTDGKWAVIQQGMNIRDKTARRYHRLSQHVNSYVEEPHEAIVGDIKREIALDMTAKESEECRKISTDIVNDSPKQVVRTLESIRPLYQKSLQEWMPEAGAKEYAVEGLSLPRTINWETLKRAYEFQPKNYEELLSLRGVGPATVRALALVSELIYGKKPSLKDPVKYSFAVGGKDGVPFPVDREAYDKSIEILENAIKQACLGEKEQLRSLQRLRQFVPSNMKKAL